MFVIIPENQTNVDDNDGICQVLDILESMFASTRVNTEFIARNVEDTKSRNMIHDNTRI
jgi:hypothetical protein